MLIDIGQLPEGQPAGEDQYLFDTCPYCFKSRKFYLNVKTGLSWCHSCEVAVPPEVLMGHLGMHEGPSRISILKRATPKKTYTKRSRPKNFMPAWDLMISRVVLQERGVKRDQVIASGLMASTKEWLLRAPIWSPMNRNAPTYWTERSLSEEQRGWKTTAADFPKLQYVFGGADPNYPCVLVEGVYDLLVPGLYHRGYAILGARIHEGLACHLQKFPLVFIWMDNDSAGRRAYRDVAKELDKWGVKHQRIEYLGDFKKLKDPGSIKDCGDRTFLYLLRSRLGI